MFQSKIFLLRKFNLMCDFLTGYGLTETSGMVAITSGPVDASEVSVSIGKVSANSEAKVVDTEGRAQPLGATGELWLRGPLIMQGYLDNPKATMDTITLDGWLKTGDIATIKDDGNIYIVDRLKEIIKVKGFQV